eukprot:UN00226
MRHWWRDLTKDFDRANSISYIVNAQTKRIYGEKLNETKQTLDGRLLAPQLLKMQVTFFKCEAIQKTKTQRVRNHPPPHPQFHFYQYLQC